MATKGYAAPEVERAYARARTLCQQVEETPELFRVLMGLHMFYRQRAELHTSSEIGAQLLSLAQSVENPEFLLVAHQALGTTLYFLGDFVQARAHLEQGVALSDSRQPQSRAVLYGQDPGVVCLSTLARTLWALGYPDDALKRAHESLALARQLSHPFSLAFALYFAAVVYQYRQEWQATQEHAEALMALSIEQGFAQRRAQGRILLGWTLVEQGRGAEGIAQLRQSVAAYGATGADLGRSSYLALLADAYGKRGQAEEGLSRDRRGAHRGARPSHLLQRGGAVPVEGRAAAEARRARSHRGSPRRKRALRGPSTRPADSRRSPSSSGRP